MDAADSISLADERMREKRQFLLSTKLYTPKLHATLVTRPHLIKQLEVGLHCQLTIVSAPAGFGKTTLVAEGVQTLMEESGRVKAKNGTFAWVSLNDNDNDPVQFLTYFIAGLQKIKADLGEAALDWLQSAAGSPIEPVLAVVINEIAELSHDITLIFDDFHLIKESEIHEAFAFFLENQPPNLHLIIISRADPPWPLARLRARRQLNEIRAKDLRFSVAETAVFLNNIMRLNLSPDDVATLDKQTEGWVTGLQMAALSMQSCENTAVFIQNFSASHAYILDYLIEEVLERQPAHIQTFLLQTAILERMTAPLCDAVTQTVGSQTILNQLEQTNLFLVPLDDERRWYRYHHLFADLLQSQLKQLQPDLPPILHHRASEWYEGAGFTEDALTHAAQAKDDSRLARLIEKYAWDMLHQSKYNTLFAWVEALPTAVIETRPWLCVYQSWTRHWAGLREGGETCMQTAEQLLDQQLSSSKQDVKERRLIGGYIATVRAHYALTNEDVPRVLEQAQKALRLLPEDDYFTRSTASVALGGAYWGIGDSVNAEQTYAECVSNALLGGYPFRASSALCYKGMHQVKQARLQQAQETFQEALALATGPGGGYFPNAGYPLAKLGELACERNDLELAQRHVNRGVELCTQLGHVDLIAEALVALARVQLAQKDFVSVKDTLRQANQLVQKSKVDPWITCWLDACRLRLWSAAGQLDEIVYWRETCGLDVNDTFSYHHDLHHINLARALVAQGGPHLDEAQSLLNRLLDAAEKAGWVHETIKILLLQALAWQAMGDIGRGTAVLTRALALAEPGGYVRLFIDEGEPMRQLLQLMQSDYARRLLVEMENRVPPSPSPLIDPLSQRELDVLRLLNTHLSSAEIAQELFIAPSTVRSHIKNIYSKLNVHRRAEAVARAEVLNLL